MSIGHGRSASAPSPEPGSQAVRRLPPRQNHFSPPSADGACDRRCPRKKPGQFWPTCALQLALPSNESEDGQGTAWFRRSAALD